MIARTLAHLQCTGESSAPRRTNANDKAGHSFSLHVREDPDHDRLLSAIVADARAGWATKAYVTGTPRTFNAATNVEKQTGINHGADASSGVVLGRRPDP